MLDAQRVLMKSKSRANRPRLGILQRDGRVAIPQHRQKFLKAHDDVRIVERWNGGVERNCRTLEFRFARTKERIGMPALDVRLKITEVGSPLGGGDVLIDDALRGCNSSRCGN